MCPSEFHHFIKPCGVEQAPLERIFVYVCKVNGVSNDTAVNILVVDVDHYRFQTQFSNSFRTSSRATAVFPFTFGEALISHTSISSETLSWFLEKFLVSRQVENPLSI